MNAIECNTPVEERTASAIEAMPRSCESAFYFWYFTTPPAALAGRFRVMST